MVHTTSCEIELGVPASAVWKLFTKDLIDVLPKLLPNIFTSIELLEGDGGVATLFLSNFGPAVHKGMTYQKEKVVEKDEGKHIIALEVIEGGHRQMGFSYYKTRFEMKDKGESSCVIHCNIEYETVSGEPVTTLTADAKTGFFDSSKNDEISRVDFC
ncbi:phytohormone-binding protein CSBP-like [Cryptomeria japonica]|uniref:phytohormone-binding protein CSBP-like n=1 Tax=Cryptomeria japonica TaxID=3369 RepID=UPI0027DA7589|nr:phytohormone-binding protein CSBP-like [Cryptomeria japonica]